MKFSFYTDIHLTDNIPCHRIDNYINILCQKVQSVYDISVQNGCDFVTFGGDLFDRHIIGSNIVVDSVEDSMEKSGLITYACIGEHDLYGHSPDTFPASTLAHLCRHTPSLRILWKPQKIGDDVVIYGKHEWQTMDEIAKTEVDPSKYNILLCHELLYDKKMSFSTTYTKDLVLPFDLVCSGDLHCGYKPHKVGKTWYCNPGSLARKATSDAKRMPKILLIETYKGHDPYIHEQILPGFKRGNEVFSVGISEVVRKFESEVDMTKFVKGFDELVCERTDIYELFDAYRQNNEVKKDVVEYMADVKKRLGK